MEKNVLKAISHNGKVLESMNGIELRQFAKSLDRSIMQDFVTRIVVEKAIRCTPDTKDAIVGQCYSADDANMTYLKAVARIKRPPRLPDVG